MEVWFPDAMIVLHVILINVIRAAGPSALRSDSGPRCPTSRYILALINGFSIEGILHSAYSPNSFTSCYLRDVVARDASFAVSALSAAKVP